MDYSRLPNELKQLNQWVCTWDNSKVPMKAFEKKAASSTAPETWGTFEQATQAVADGKYDHIGFVFADNGLVGIDIDVGFDDGLLTPLCADIMKACHSYTEKSRSGRGVHILLRGDLPFTGRNNLRGVEIYKARRFFICTGRVLIFPEIVENQEGIDYVVQKYFPTPAEKDSTGKKPLVQKIYAPVFHKPEGGKVFVRPEYPEIVSGGRNLSLTSLAGAMWNTGYTKQQIYKELCYVNQTACKPPLQDQELQTICNSVTRYRR
ncbi:MAG: primase C-terminal domain-containing protein [Clostridia bacterium]|nr:primase C-terminal domain-containing protein [Clostridia bacterium]